MSTHSAPRDPASTPRRTLMPILIPGAVLLCTAGLIAWNAWPVMRASRSIEVTQAIFVPGVAPTEEQSQEQPIRGTRTVQAAGWLESQPFIIAATALADGVVSEMLVLEGERVEEGQVLALLVHDDAAIRLDRARARFARAQAGVRDASAQLAAAQQNWDEPYELKSKAESAEARLNERRAELAQLPALIRVDEAISNQAVEELKSIEAAYQSNAAAEIEYVTAREHANALSAKLDATRGRDAILRASIDRLESDLRAARRALELRIDDRARLDRARAAVAMREADVADRRALVREAELELERMTIRAPISGYVQRRLKAPGDKVVRMMDSPHSAHIAHLYDPSRLQVRVDVPLADASQIFAGQRCQVVVEVLPNRTFVGEVLIVTHEADLQKNTLQIKVRVIDPDPILRPEMLTRVKFLPSSGAQSEDQSGQSAGRMSVRVPGTAIDTASGELRVWVVTDRVGQRGVLRPTPVTVMDLAQNDDWVTISGSIQPGSVIAADPSGCTPGERVRMHAENGDAS